MRPVPLAHRVAAVIVAVLLGGCERVLPRRTELQVGEHRVSLRAPRAWRYLDHGHEKLFRHEGSRLLHVVDLGPITGAGYARELEQAHDLIGEGRSGLGNERISAFRVPRELFGSKEAFDLYDERLSALRMETRRGDEGKGTSGFEALHAQLEGLAPPAPDVLVELALKRVGHEPWEREIESVADVSIAGRPARVVTTWDKRTHRGRQRHALVVHEGRLLMVRTSGYGEGEEAVATAFEGVVSSLEIVEAEAAR